MNYRLYNVLEIQQSLGKQFPGWLVDGPAIYNAWYCAPTRAWVDGPFAKYFFDYLNARDQRAYAKRGNQCEHFALRAALEAVDLFRRSRDAEIPAQAESLGVAWCKYRRADGAWHEVNLWLLDGVWQPWEPQLMRFFTLNFEEVATVQQIGVA